jgi:hypothetical protein
VSFEAELLVSFSDSMHGEVFLRLARADAPQQALWINSSFTKSDNVGNLAEQGCLERGFSQKEREAKRERWVYRQCQK